MKNHTDVLHRNVSSTSHQYAIGYEPPMTSTLKSHIESTRENITYPCDQCEYIGTQKNDLKLYMECVHIKLPILVINVTIRQLG